MTSPEPAVPPQAITAAAEAISRELNSGDVYQTHIEHDEHLARVALEAAAPHLAEGGWDAARDRATEANEARRDERERCAQLAEQVAASYAPTNDAGYPYDLRLFADLLRQGGEGGTDG